MKIDHRLLAGILIGALMGLQYHAALMAYLPFLVIGALILLLQMIHH